MLSSIFKKKMKSIKYCQSMRKGFISSFIPITSLRIKTAGKKKESVFFVETTIA